MSPINSRISHSFATATTFPKIVTNGLVFNYDAGQQNSYIGIGTIWKDLSGNGSNGEMANMDGSNFNSANGGFLTFDGTNELVKYPKTITVTDVTFLAFLKKNGTTQYYSGVIFSDSPTSNGMDIQDTNGNCLGYHWNGTNGTLAGLPLPDQEWIMCAITISYGSPFSSLTGYVGRKSTGILTQTASNINNSSQNLNNLRVAKAGTSGRYFKGDMAVAMVYNRALSAREIQNNFDALRGRFKI